MRSPLAAFALLLIAAAPPPDAGVPPEMQRVVIDHFSPMFVIPQTAIWEFDSMSHYLLGGTLICGKVNFQDSLRHYRGKLPFYLVIKSGNQIGDGDLMPLDLTRDPTGTKRSTYRQVCKPK